MNSPTLPKIPEKIIVHLGKPNQNSANVQVPFAEYIKNVASSEVYPTWPENALRANIYAQISYALNRVYTEWYRGKGYDFDITNSTQYDQAYVPGRDIFGNISELVDQIFNDYVRKRGSVEPYFTQFCNGTTVTCDGLSQWGTVALAKQGMTPYQILQHYYGQNIDIVKNAPVESVYESYPGVPLRIGSAGNNVRVIQVQLRRIRQNFPSVTAISEADGVFGPETQSAVKSFQKAFNLTPDGIVGKSTWYKIKDVYNGVKELSELTSEGIRLEEVTPIFPVELAPGSSGMGVPTVQYYLNIIGYFNPALQTLPITGFYDAATTAAVRAFQQQYGLPVTGVTNNATWNKLQEVYAASIAALPVGYEGAKAELYPGYVLTSGMQDQNVEDLQTYLAAIAQEDPAIPKPGITGYFGPQTYNAVLAFQKEYGLPQTGVADANTWAKIANAFDARKGLA